MANAVTEMLRRNARTRMTVLWVDNLQWADAMLRDYLAVVVRSLGDLPFLLVTGQRPDPDVLWPPPVDRPLVLQVPLGPLDRTDSMALVRGILERSEPVPDHDERTISELVDRGGGNPLFLVELAALAVGCPNGSELPGSLRALIAARVDQLPGPQRAILDNAAVLGHRDITGALARFAEEMGQEFRQGDLVDLAATGLLELDGKWWQFRSDVVREVVYQTLTKRVRAQRHAGIAAVLAARGYSIDDVAHHAATAAELVVELGADRGCAAVDRRARHRRAPRGGDDGGQHRALRVGDPPCQPRPRPAPRRPGDGAPAAARAGDGRAGAPGVRRGVE